ncbi:MAG: ATP-binding protein [Pseudomonadales bacterium]
MTATHGRFDASPATDSRAALKAVIASAIVAAVLLALALLSLTLFPAARTLVVALLVASLIAIGSTLWQLRKSYRASAQNTATAAQDLSAHQAQTPPAQAATLAKDTLHNLATATDNHEQLLRDIINQIPYPLFAQDSAGQVLFVNSALAALYGTTPAKLVQPDDSNHLRKISSEDLLTRPAGDNSGEEWLTTIDGEERRYLVQRLPFHSTVEGELVVAVDVTELHRLQLQLQFSQRLEVLGTLAGGIAHDFNNLLTPILGYSSLLLEEQLPETHRTKVEAIATSANRARTVAQQMLSFSRQSDDLTNREHIDLTAIIEEAVEFMRASVPPNVNIRIDLLDRSAVIADAGQLHQVLVNLCMNAVQAIEKPSGEVLVSCRSVAADHPDLPASLPERDYALIQVTDNGIGMSEAVMSHVFEPFFTTKDIGEGNGLGLSTAKGIISRHQGDISVTSSEQSGTCFSVYLPLAGARQQGQPEPANNARILLVDDEAMVLQVLEDLLSTQGFVVTACAEPKHALELLADPAVAIDVLVTDNNMPRMKGTELAHRARNLRAQLPVILITGYAEPPLAEQAHVSRSLQKPVATKDLTAAIRELLNAHKAA